MSLSDVTFLEDGGAAGGPLGSVRACGDWLLSAFLISRLHVRQLGSAPLMKRLEQQATIMFLNK